MARVWLWWFGIAVLCVAVRSSDETLQTDEKVEDNRGSEEAARVRSMLECVLSADWSCVQVKTVRALRVWLKMGTVEESTEQSVVEAESKEGEGDEEENEDHDEYNEEYASSAEEETTGSGGQLPGHSLLEQLAEALVDGVSAIFLADSEEERSDLAQRGTKELDKALNQLAVASPKRKGGHGGHGGGGHIGGHHGHGAGELIAVIMMLKSGLMSIGTGFAALIQLKTFAFTILGVIMSAVRLYMQFKALHRPEHPPVIKIFQVHSAVEQEKVEVEHEVHSVDVQPHHPYQPQLPYFAHDRAYIAQKPVRKQQKKEQQLPIILMPNRP